MSYGPALVATRRRAAFFVNKILKVAEPADLPVEQPTKFELVIKPQDCQRARPYDPAVVAAAGGPDDRVMDRARGSRGHCEALAPPGAHMGVDSWTMHGPGGRVGARS